MTYLFFFAIFGNIKNAISIDFWEKCLEYMFFYKKKTCVLCSLYINDYDVVFSNKSGDIFYWPSSKIFSINATTGIIHIVRVLTTLSDKNFENSNVGAYRFLIRHNLSFIFRPQYNNYNKSRFKIYSIHFY